MILTARALRLLSIVGLLFGLSLPVTGSRPTQDQAEQKSAKLSGHIFDRNGAVIVGATVSMVGNRNAKFHVQTDTEGVYRMDVPPDLYSIEIMANGFQPFSLDCYQVPAASINLDVTLTVSGEPACAPCRRKAKNDSKIIITEL